MCVNAANVPEDEQRKFHQFVQELVPGALKEFLTTIYNLLADGETLCMAMALPEVPGPAPTYAPPAHTLN